MAIKKEYKEGNSTREAIKKVSIVIGRMVGKTLGPAGRNFQIPSGITNDGRSILAHIRFDDECEDNVALAYHEIANKTDTLAGDGTSTAVTVGTKLGETVIDKVPDLDAPIPGQESVMDLSRRLEDEKNKVIELLSKRVTPVTTLEDLEKIAFTSMEDKEAAKIVAATIFEAGAESFTALEEGFTGKIETHVQPGIELPVQVAAPFMYNNGDKQLKYEGTIPVLIANHLFEEYREITKFLETMLAFAKEQGTTIPAVVIIGKQFSIPFVQTVKRVFAGSQGKINIVLLSNTHLADDLFGDAAAFCGGELIDTHPKNGVNMSTVEFSAAGFVKQIIATPKGAVLFGGQGNVLTTGETTPIASRILEIRGQLSEERDPQKRKALERRIAEFSGGKATIYVDAPTAAEKYYLKLKVEDCMNSCKAALEGGMVRGGGITLSEIADELGEDALIYQALKEPAARIQLNAGGNLEIGEDVVDSYLVAKAGIESAVSVVKILLTIEGIIADVPESLLNDLQRAITEA